MGETPNELVGEGYRARRLGKLKAAKERMTEGVASCRKSGSPDELARAVTGLGQIERDLQNLDAAVQCYQEAAAIYRTESNDHHLAHTLRHLGDIHQDAGSLPLAEPYYVEALDLYRNRVHPPPLEMANAIRGMALLKEARGQRDEARSLWTEAKELYSRVDVEAGVTESSEHLATLS